jgi:hypothetical protein
MLNQGFLCLRKPRLGAHDNGQQIKPTSAAIHSSLEMCTPYFCAKAKEKSPKTMT